jgi:EpsI family protein
MEIAGYKGVGDRFSRSVYEELNADTHVYRHYTNVQGEQVALYIGYYGTAKGGRTGHNPYACLPGAGWAILDRDEVTLKNDRYPQGQEVNYILSEKGSSYEVVYHWYQSAEDKVLDSGIEQNIQRFVGCVFHNRNDGAFVRISSRATADTIERKKIIAKRFASRILNILPDYWPVEKEL